MNTGVYAIVNKVNGKIYVGSAALSIKGRWATHKSELRSSKHCNSYLQRAWDKYGEDNFEFKILRLCRPFACIKLEQFYMDRYQSYDPKFGYNLYPIAGSPLGVKRPASVGKAVAEANRRRVVSPQTRLKMAEAKRGKPLATDVVGEANGNSKLQESEVREIKRLFLEGVSKQELALKFSISWTTVHDILIRRRWRHVD